MPTIADLKLELDDAQTLSVIASAFTEAAAARIGKIKAEFERNRQFYDEISHVYHLVRVAATTKDVKGDSDKKLPPPPSEPKVLSVAITSNQRFYGNLNVNIMRGFLEQIQKEKTDILVMGTTGHDFMKSSGYVHPYDSMNFIHDVPTAEETRAFLDKAMAFDTVMVYYPKFVSLVTQTVGVIDISQAVSPTDKTGEEEIHILFEPEYPEILTFFQRQVRSILFLRVMLEADLSRTAARLLTMSAAEERSTELIKQKKSQLRKIQMSILNAKLLETFAGISKWKK